MTEIKEKPTKVVTEPQGRAQRDDVATTFRPILIAACVGVLIGLLLKR